MCGPFLYDGNTHLQIHTVLLAYSSYFCNVVLMTMNLKLLIMDVYTSLLFVQLGNDFGNARWLATLCTQRYSF